MKKAKDIKVVPLTPQAPKNEATVRTLKMALETAEQNENTPTVFVLMKVNNQYLRYSTGLDDPMEVVSQFEIGKMDIFLQMAGLVETDSSS